MKNLLNKIKIFVFFLTVFSIFTITPFIPPVNAKCPENVVPNILDPNCDLPQGQSITLGFLINRFVVFLPYFVTILAVGTFAWGSVKVILSQDEDGRKEGIQILINTAIGLGLFFSIWLVLFMISIITGVDLLKAIGQ